MCRICCASFAVTGFCASLVFICFMKGRATRAQVPPFHFGRTGDPRSSPFLDAHPLSEEGELPSESPDTSLWESMEKACETEAAASNQKAEGSPHKAGRHEGEAPVNGGEPVVGRAASQKASELPIADGETSEDLFEGSEPGLQADTADMQDPDYVCKQTSLLLQVESPGEKLFFRCGNAGADLRPGTSEVFQGNTCSGAPVLLCTLVPGATLLHEAYAENHGWMLSIGKLPPTATTVCYQCQAISDEGLPSVCSIIIDIAGAESTNPMEVASAAEQSTLATWAVLEAAGLATVVFTLAL